MPEKTLPIKIGFLTKGYVYHPFSFLERLKVLFGYNLILQNNLASQHNPGKTQIASKVHIIGMRDPKAAIHAIEEEDMRLGADRVKKMGATAKSKHEEPQK